MAVSNPDDTNWKQRYEKEKKAKSRLVQEYKQKLKKAKFEMEKVSNYYRKQIEIFKNKQTELLKHISSTHYSSTKQSIKYVFIEDIQQIKLSDGVRSNASVHITFKNGEQSIFNNIDIVDTNNHNSGNNAGGGCKHENSQNTKQNDEVEAILYDELEKRIQDIDNLINITFGEKYMINDHEDDEDELIDHKNDDISLAMRLRLIEYVNEIKMRHNQYNLVHRIEQNSTTLDDIKHAIKRNEKTAAKQDDVDKQRQLSANKMNLQRLHKNNAFWRNLLLNFPVDIVGILCFELNDRIHDVQNVKDVLYKNEEEAIYDSMDDIMADIKTRHKDSFRSWTKTDNTHKLSEKWENIIGEVNINNTRWRKQIHFDPVPVPQSSTAQHNNNNTDNAYASITSSCSNWLLKDENRNEFLDSLQVNHHTVRLLKYIGAYLNRMIPANDDDIEHMSLVEVEYNELQALYIPIVTNDPYNVLAACLDGVLFAVLLNKLESNCIDLRVLQLPSEPLQPLSENQISENIMIIFSTLEGLNIQLPQWNMEDYFDANNTVNIILCIVFQIFYAMLDREINLHVHPELLRLCQNDAEIQNAPYLSSKKWLNKWLLHLKNPQKIPLQSIKTHKRDSLVLKKTPILLLSEEKEKEKKDKKKKKKQSEDDKKNGNKEKENVNRKETVAFEADAELIRHILHTIDYHDYLILICCRMDKEFLTDKLPQIQSHRRSSNSVDNKSGAGGDSVDDIFTSKLLLECIVNIIGTKTVVRIEDIASHNPLLQQLLICDIFRGNNKIQALSNTEKKSLGHIVHMPTKEENMFVAWINAYFGDNKWYINNLEYALNDGVIILKLLDKLKRGCVKWKEVRQKHEIRHKFDRLTNCKLIMDVCSDHFLFNLIGMNGSDIADGNLKYINILLWHIMCYGTTRLLSEIKYNGKQVTEKMILQWTNNRIKQYKKHCANSGAADDHKILKLVGIKSLRDHSLNDSILFLNLLSSICDQWVNYQFVHDVAAAAAHHNHQYKKERVANATYCITIIRKLSGKLFVAPSDICNADEKAIYSILTSIMIIAEKHS